MGLESPNDGVTNSAGWNGGRLQGKAMFGLALVDEQDFSRRRMGRGHWRQERARIQATEAGTRLWIHLKAQETTTHRPTYKTVNRTTANVLSQNIILILLWFP